MPTPRPTTFNPTPKPTKDPTLSPVKESCPYEIGKGLKFDFIVLFDNTCGLSEGDCDIFLNGITEIVGSILDYPYSRVQTMQFEEEGDPTIVVSFDDEPEQKDRTKYRQRVYDDGECMHGGDGDTDLKTALKVAKNEFDITDDRIDRVIIVSACMDEEPKAICEHIAPKYDDAGIEVWVVNLIRASDADNVIANQEWADDYLACLVNCEGRICTGEDKHGVNIHEFHTIIDDCLSPYICLPPSPEPTAWPSYVYMDK